MPSPPALPADASVHSGQLDVERAADFLGLSPTALRRLERAGEIPSVRIGRRVLFRRESLAAFLEAREHVRPVRP